MAESSAPTFTSILEYLHLTLRYIASGFVAVGVYIFLYNPEITEFKDQSWFLTFITATIGIITYGLHFATLDKIFYGWSIMHFLKNNKNFIPEILKEQICQWQVAKGSPGFEKKDILAKLNKEKFWGIKSNTKIKRYILFALANQTYLRSISKNEALAAMQNQVEKRLALLNFLYCSSYQIIIILLYFGINRFKLHAAVYWPDAIKVITLIVFAAAILYSAILFNRRICGREMWLIQNFPQEIKAIE